MSTVDRMIEEVRDLSPEDLGVLIDAIMETVHRPDPAWEQARIQLLERRSDEIKEFDRN